MSHGEVKDSSFGNGDAVFDNEHGVELLLICALFCGFPDGIPRNFAIDQSVIVDAPSDEPLSSRSLSPIFCMIRHSTVAILNVPKQKSA